MSCSIDLGERDFSSPVSDLTLSVHVTASILLSPEYPIPDDPELLKEALCSGDIWVAQAPELGFDICISSSLDFPFSLGHFVSQLGASICKAKMWSDLGLSVVYKSCLDKSDQTSSAHILSFGIQKQLVAPKRAKTARVPKILKNVGEANPPDDTPTARITSVDVHLEYKHSRKRGTTNVLQTESQSQSHYTPLSPGSSDPYELENLFRNTSVALETNEFIPEEEDSEMIIDDDELFDLPMSRSSSHSELGTLFRSGFRALLWGDQRRRSKAGTETFRSLSSIAPSVFKPGYREAMNQRQRLIPLIAKSLTSLLNLSDNQALKDRITSVAAPANSDFSSQPPTADDGTKALFKTKLWSIAQKRLHHAQTPKLLKPSNTFLEPEQTDEPEDENLFSETLSSKTDYPYEEDENQDHNPGLHPGNIATVSHPDSSKAGVPTSEMMFDNDLAEDIAERDSRSSSPFMHAPSQHERVGSDYEMLDLGSNTDENDVEGDDGDEMLWSNP